MDTRTERVSVIALAAPWITGNYQPQLTINADVRAAITFSYAGIGFDPWTPEGDQTATWTPESDQSATWTHI